MPQLDDVRMLLASKLGKVLMPEDAAAIEAALFYEPDLSHNPAKFDSIQHGRYTIQAERFSNIIAELHHLHQVHWLETEKHRHGLELNPDYEAFLVRERAGRLLQFTMRDEYRRLVGNLRMFIGTSLHTQTEYASEDVMFLLPEHRGSFAALALIRFAEQSLRAIGIREIRVNSKLVNRADVLMLRMGYGAVALEFVKFFEES
jgi:hypothetical protein